MGKIDFSKITTFISILAIAVVGLYRVLNQTILAGVFPQLSQNQGFIIICLILVIGFLVFLTLLFTYVLKPTEKEDSKEKADDKPKEKEKDKPKRKKRTFVIGTILLVLPFLIIGWYAFSKLDLMNSDYILNENFTKNNFPEIWREGEQEEAKVKIENGELEIKVIGNHPVSRRIDLEKEVQYSLIDSINYNVKLRLKMLEENPKGLGSGLQWSGNSKEGFFYGFYINFKEEFSIKIYNFGKPIRDILAWQIADNIKKDDFNELEIRQMSDRSIFILNGQKVASFRDLEPIGNEIGFGIASKSRAKIDYLKLRNNK